MKKIDWDVAKIYLDLVKPENEERNGMIKDAVDRYADGARVGRKTLVKFCIAMFCAGAEYQQQIINAEMACECPSVVIGNTFITAMAKAIKEADNVAFASDLPGLLECGKAAFNNGIHYANNRLHDAVNDINDMDHTIL